MACVGLTLVPAPVLEVVGATWCMGSVDLRQLSAIEDIRAAATYLSKTFDTHHDAHRQRYAAGQGFTPVPLTLPAQDLVAGAQLAEQIMGRPADSSARPFEDSPGSPLLLQWSDRGGGTS